MINLRSRWSTTTAAVAAAALVAAVVPIPGIGHAENENADAGIVCTESASNSFVLTARDGRIATPDGNTVYMWSYAAGSHGFQYPGPMLCVKEGTAVTVTLQNRLAVPTSILFEGVTGVLADGVPASVQTDGSGRLTSLIQPAAPSGSITYTFTAPPAGTYLYESGTDHQLQREMGLHGGLIVRPANFGTGSARTVYGDPSTSYDVDQEYVHLLSQVDPSLHLAVETGQPVDFSQYRPRYFMINGRSFPDTIAPNGAPWLPDQPYGALVHLMPIGQGQALPSIIRYLNAGPTAVPFHPHSNHEEVIGIDARQLLDGATSTRDVDSIDRFGIDVQAGQTAEGRFSWTNTTWGGGGSSPGNPVPDQRNLNDGGFWSGDILLGQSQPKPPGGDAFNECGEYYHVAHNHALYAATNYGAAMGGQLTLVRVDPPGGC